MKRSIIRSLMFLGALGVIALGGRAEEAEPTSGIDPKCEAAVREMGQRLAAAKALTFNAYTCQQHFLNDGQRVEFAHNQRVFVRRPDHIAAIIQGDEGDSQFIFDGSTVTLDNVRDHVYGQTEIEGNLDNLFDTLASRYGMTLPLVDLVLADPGKALLSHARSCDDLGVGYVFDTKCRHLAIRQEAIDWEIWIQQGDQPLPRKLVITYKDSAGSPQYVAYLSDWNLAAEVPDARFSFHPAPDDKRVDFAMPPQTQPSAHSATK